MFKEPISHSFDITNCGNKVASYCVVVADASEANPGYLVCIICDKMDFKLTIPYAPSERYLQALGDFIRASVKKTDDCYGFTGEFMINEHRRSVVAIIRRFCFKVIEQDAIKRLNEGFVTADHYYLCCDTMTAKREGVQSRALVNAYKNGVLINTLDSKELRVFLNEHPEAPVYQTTNINAIEDIILAAADIDVLEKIQMILVRSHFTCGERFRENFAKINNEGLLLFTKNGVAVPEIMQKILGQ